MHSMDREALLALYKATGGPTWKRKHGWDTSADISEWGGVSTNDEGRVVKLNLNDNNLRGSLPPQLGGLPKLEVLEISNNRLTGLIPKELGHLKDLKFLIMVSNKLEGLLPPELGDLHNLQNFFISDNNFTGPLPPELGGLHNLEKFDISHNHLAGVLPKELGQLKVLKSLSMENNNLKGPLPPELGDLPKLEEFVISDNHFTELPKKILKVISKCVLWEASGNPFLRPPATVVDIGLKSALGWWSDVERFGESTSNKLKMVLVGLPEAGKTTLVRHFTGKLTEQEPERTVGVDITPDWRPLEGGSLQVNIWDFAGQEDYYSSHQLFLTKGSLFILVVDLNAFAKEVSHGPDNFTDPNGRVYWWLEMLHMRVPGAAVVLVGSHVDELADNGNEADQASRDLLSVANNFIKHKEKTISTIQSDLKMAVTNEPDPENEFSPAGGSHPRGGRTRALAKHLVVHQRVFKASLDPQSILKLREWILKAAMGEDCPVGFDFPSVNKSVPKPWIDAFSAMETLEKETPYVLWSKAVEVFRGICTPEILPEADDLLFRAMKHREAEGGVLLSRSGFLAPKDDDMLHLDPTWLVQLVRRLADHNLVEDQEQGTIRLELHAYSEEKHLDFQPLWKTHCDYCKSGQLDKAYLRYLWTYRKIDPPGRTVDVGDVEIESIVTMMTDVEIESIVTMMTRLLVMYKSRSSGHKLLVPARLPQHGDLQVLAPDLMKGIVVKTQCSFMQVYPPPGIVGRFLAWSIDQIAEVRQCWQHGAFFMYKFQTGLFEVVMYESVDDIHHRDGMLQKKFSALTFGVRGSSERARTALDELTESVENLVRDPAHGYPGLGASICFKGVTEDSGRDIISEIRALGEIVRTLESVVKMLLKQKLLAAREDSSEYPRLVILEPENTKMSVKSGAPDKQRFTWMKAAWEKVRFSDALHHTFRLRFCCEHDLSEVPCGPDGRGYLLKKNKEWVKSFFPLMQASLWIVRVAVGIVSNVDLPLNDVLGAVVAATGAELLEGLGTEVPASFRSIEKGIFPEFGSKSAQSEKQKFAKLKGEAYKVFCDLMREIESTPSLANSDWLPLRSSRPESVVSWRDEMVEVDNGSGGLAWVLKKNKDAYLQRLK